MTLHVLQFLTSPKIDEKCLMFIFHVISFSVCVVYKTIFFLLRFGNDENSFSVFRGVCETIADVKIKKLLMASLLKPPLDCQCQKKKDGVRENQLRSGQGSHFKSIT